MAAWRDAGLTASPNAGWPMAAAAGALDIRLEKADHYVLNPDGRLPGAEQIGRAQVAVAGGWRCSWPRDRGALEVAA